MADETVYPCVVCNSNVLEEEQALECDTCSRWQHRACGSGISRRTYYRMVRGSIDVDWSCEDCRTSPVPSLHLSTSIFPVAESTRTSLQRLDEDTENDQANNNTSFEVAVTFEERRDISEDDITDPLPETMQTEETTLYPRYTIVEEGSQRLQKKLVDNRGYSFTVKSRRATTTYWTCSVRSKANRCPATVIQKDEDMFTNGIHPHNHPGQVGLLAATTVVTEVKRRTRNDVFRSAAVVVEDVVGEIMNDSEPCPALPKPVNIARAANRGRKKLRPADPTDLEFEVAEDFIEEDFFRADVHVGDQRHLIFATTPQLELLGRSKTWYIDGTFKVVREPFAQMLSIHAFVKSPTGDLKQVPLLFCMMSRRRRRDYKKVFFAVADLIPSLNVREVVTDFEAALWKGFQEAFPGIPVRGCCFHWNQAVFRKIQQLGLEPAYVKQEGTYRLLRKVLSLPFLPHEHIPAAFEHLARQAVTTETEQLMDYVRATWLDSSVWPISSWSVFGLSVRTNNDVEGWHRRLNARAMRAGLQFYVLIQLLHKEAELVKTQLKLISEGKLRRLQRKHTTSRQAKIAQLWEDYREGNKTASQLLRAAGPLEKVTIPKDKEGVKKKYRFGFVTFKHEASVPYTLQLFEGIQLYGRQLHLKNRNSNQESGSPKLSPGMSPPVMLPNARSPQMPPMNQGYFPPGQLNRSHTWHGNLSREDGGKQYHRQESSSPSPDSYRQSPPRWPHQNNPNQMNQSSRHDRYGQKPNDRYGQQPNDRYGQQQNQGWFNQGSMLPPNDIVNSQNNDERRQRILRQQRSSIDAHRQQHPSRHQNYRGASWQPQSHRYGRY